MSDGQCPNCGSAKIIGLLTSKPLMACITCRKAWEPLPAGYTAPAFDPFFPFDQMCDNCAFRKGSKERQDKQAWADLLQRLIAGGRFYCHKGVPFEPQSTVQYEYPRTPDGHHDTGRMRICRGFLDFICSADQPEKMRGFLK